MSFCQNCGANLEGGSTFCPYCGQPVDANNGMIGNNTYNNTNYNTNNAANYNTNYNTNNTANYNTNYNANNTANNSTNNTVQRWKELLYAKFTTQPDLLKMVAMIGSVIMFLSPWMPFVSIKAYSYKVSENVWLLCDESDLMSLFFVYLSLICVIVATVFIFLNQQRIVAWIASVIAILPTIFLIFACIGEGLFDSNGSFAFGCFTYFLGFAIICFALKVQGNLSKTRFNQLF